LSTAVEDRFEDSTQKTESTKFEIKIPEFEYTPLPEEPSAEKAPAAAQSGSAP
jgi:hypothetical protein